MITLDTLDHALHSVKIGDGTDFLAIAADGSIAVTDNGGSLTVDGTVELGATTLAALENITATISGDVNVTQGTSPWVIGDGGGSITVDAVNLDIRDLAFATDKVDVSGSTINVLEGGFASWSVVAASVDTTAGGTQLAASPLSGRLKIEIQNLGSNDVYIRQATGVTTSNGLKIPKGSSYEQTLDDGAAIWAIAASGTADLRIAQYAA